ncbi:AMP-binding protein [bacterium]|nr:AMP-binding protein [bacterium]
MAPMALVLALIRSGIFPLAPWDWWKAARAWWRCGSSLAFLLELTAARFPGRPALHDEQGRLSFAQLQQGCLALACGLRAQGFTPGQQVALLARNHRGFVLGLLALSRLGVDVLPLGSDLPEAVMLRILERQKISTLVHDGERSLELPGIRLLDLAEVQAQPAQLPRTSRPGQLVVLTSGSTGISKGIRRRPRLHELLPLLAGLLQGLPLRRHRPLLLAIPLHHGYGLAALALALALAAPLYVRRRYEVGPLLQDAASVEPGLLVSVPTLLLRWLNSETVSRLPAAIITGSAPLEASLCSRLLRQCGPVLYNLYGSSEGGVIALAGPERLTQSPGCVGRPLPGNQVRLDGEGRICVRGPLVLMEETGDLGRWDEHGNLHVLGRADSMIVCGGENVYPHELEEALLKHPQILEAAVVAVPDSEFGQRLVAAVVARQREDFMAWLRQRLERYKLPRELRVVETIPRNPLGKVDRPALLRLFEAG